MLGDHGHCGNQMVACPVGAGGGKPEKEAGVGLWTWPPSLLLML